MGAHTGIDLTRIRRSAAACAVALATTVVSLLAVPAASAEPAPRAAPPSVRVGSYNLYLGTDVAPLLSATTLEELIQRATEGYAQVQATNFPERADALAELIARRNLDVVGLQEVALWETAPIESEDFTTDYDFLELLLDALAARGTPYRPVATNINFSNAAFPIPISTERKVRFTDRDVILVSDRTGAGAVTTRLPRERTFASVLTVNVLGEEVRVTRGWSTVNVRVRGVRFRFANTHLEAVGVDLPVRSDQATEFVEDLKLAKLPVIAVGDFNTKPTGCGNDDTAAYEILAATKAGDAWPRRHPDLACEGFTGTQAADLLNADSQLSKRIDYVFFDRRFFRVRAARILGEESADRSTPTGLWPSDHAGLAVRLQQRP